MKALGKLARTYLAVGGLLGIIVWASYMWGIGWGAPEGMGFIDRVVANLTLQPSFLFSAVLRALLWLPSLVLWFTNPMGVSFGQWLAPGFYIEAIESGV